jgi:hypothetical protein
MIDKLLDMKPDVTIELGSLVGEAFLYDGESFKLILDHLYSKGVNISVFTSLYNINMDVIEHFNELVELTVSLYGYDEKSFKERTGRKYKAVLNNLNRIADQPRPFHLVLKNRSGGPHTNLPNELKDKIAKNIPLLKQYGEANRLDFVWDDCISDKPYTHMPERNGICEYATLDAGFDYDGNFVLCAWLDTNSVTAISHLDNPTDQIVEDYNRELTKQQFNMFNSKCAMCDGYLAYKNHYNRTNQCDIDEVK